MEITCWNCKTVTNVDNAGVMAAIKNMDETKLGFFDVPCASCGKINRTQRAVFTAAMSAQAAAMPAPASTAAVAPKATQRELTKQTKEENAKRRGGEGKPDKKGPRK